MYTRNANLSYLTSSLQRKTARRQTTAGMSVATRSLILVLVLSCLIVVSLATCPKGRWCQYSDIECELMYCNKHPDLKDGYCGGNTCSTSSQAGSVLLTLGQPWDWREK